MIAFLYSGLAYGNDAGKEVGPRAYTIHLKYIDSILL